MAEKGAFIVPTMSTYEMLFRMGRQAGFGEEGMRKLNDVREGARQIMRANETNPDPSTSMALVTGALLALYARRTQGIGQQVDMNMFIANAYANAMQVVAVIGPSNSSCAMVEIPILNRAHGGPLAMIRRPRPPLATLVRAGRGSPLRRRRRAPR